MNYNETLKYIHSLGMFSHSAGLERITKVLQILGNPQDCFKSIHIAGTNGKGSVSVMLSSVYKEYGLKVGAFISPFIIDFRERIQINGEYISENDLVYYAKRVKKTNIALTEFEFITALAFLYFKEKNIDLLVCETGLGGRLDATNTLENLICTVITKIGLDHIAVLGGTIEKITEEKCGILRNCPTVTSPCQNPNALKIIKLKAKRLVVPDVSRLEILKTDRVGNTFIYKGEKFETSLCGEYQIENALIAIETVKNSGYDIPYNIMCDGLKKATIPARLEIVSQEPLTVIDGAHNPDGADVLARELSKLNEEPVAIIGMMEDKNVEEVLEKTLKHCKSAIAVTVENNPRSLKSEELCRIANKYCPCETANNLNEAIEKTKGQPTFVFGSLYLAAEIRKKLI